MIISLIVTWFELLKLLFLYYDIGLVSMVTDENIGKPDNALSIADSALGTDSVVSGTTFAGVSQFSEVRQWCQMRTLNYTRD